MIDVYDDGILVAIRVPSSGRFRPCESIYAGLIRSWSGGNIVPRSLKDAGLISIPFWLTAEQVNGQPFYVVGASVRNGRFGEQIVMKLRLRDGAYDADGELHKIVHLSLSLGGEGQRRDFARYFQNSTDPLGPCIFVPVPTGNGLSDFYRVEDATPEMLAEAPSEPLQIETRARDETPTFDDVPF